MPWPRGSLLAALLVLSVPLACADTITVNTTTDDNAVNSLCSLREAVEYFNQGKPAAGYQGCVAATGTTGNAGDIITLASDAAHPYLVSSPPIYIHRSVTINGAGATGATRTLIKAVDSNRIFVFYDKPTFQAAACGLSVPATCYSPDDPVTLMKAPLLAPSSDTGASSSDFLTSDNTPEFSGSVNGPASDDVVVDTSTPGTTITTTTVHHILIRLYQTSAVNVTPVYAGFVDVAGHSNSTGTLTPWTASTSALPVGDQSIFYTTQEYSVITTHKVVNTVPVTPDVISFSPFLTESAASPAAAIRVYPASISQAVVLNQLDLEGCALGAVVDCSASADVRRPDAGEYIDTVTGLTYYYDVAGTAGKGGIVYGTGNLTLTNMILHDGHASMGGAVYIGTEGRLRLSLSEVRDNTASHGAAAYVANNFLIVSQSLLTANTVGESAATGAAVVEVSSAVSPPGGVTVIENSTFSGNAGVALSLLANSTVSSSTIVLNDGGINFNGATVSVYNSVVAGNPDKFPGSATATDCMNLPVTPDFRFSVTLSGGGCDAAGSAGLTLLFNDAVAGHEPDKLMAALGGNGRCTGYPALSPVPPAFKGMGVLCPLLDNGGATRTHMIRLLPAYMSVADSPLMAKGPSASTTTAACASTDQRNKVRHTPCDVGAFELQPLAGPVTSGDVITYGQTYTPEAYALGDEELVDPSVSGCPAQTQLIDINKMGCPWLEKAPVRGTVTFNQDGTYTYKPNSDFHGFDRFTIRVVTTLSRLNSAPDSRSRVISAQVIVEPTSGIGSSSLGGAFDWEVMLLGGLLGFVRRRCKEGGE